MRPTDDGGQIAILIPAAPSSRAPAPSTSARVHVVWHELDTNDLSRAMTSYHELFGWQSTDRLGLGASASTGTFYRLPAR